MSGKTKEKLKFFTKKYKKNQASQKPQQPREPSPPPKKIPLTSAGTNFDERLKKLIESRKNFLKKNEKEYEPAQKYEKKNYNVPSKSIVFKGLSAKTTSDQLRNAVYQACGSIPSDVKIVKDKFTGLCTGIGFLDFDDVEQATKVLEEIGKTIYIGSDKILLGFSQTSQKTANDWHCTHCYSKNHYNRVKCHDCNQPRIYEKSSTDGSVKEKSNKPVFHQFTDYEIKLKGRPTVELLVRGLDVYTNEEILIQTYCQLALVKAVRVVRDKFSQISKRYAFVEFFSVKDSTTALRYSKGLKVDNATVEVTFARRAHLEPILKTENANDAARLASWYSAYEYKEKQEKQDLTSQGGYVYDKSNGYYFNSKFNYYFDRTTGYFYSPSQQCWMYFDPLLRKYTKIETQAPSQTYSSISTGTTSYQAPKKIEQANELSSGFIPNPMFKKALHRVEQKEKHRENMKKKAKLKKRNRTQANVNVKSKEEKEEKKRFDESNNIGARLMKKLGWKEGEGLGRDKKGRKDIINVTKRNQGVGLGHKDSEQVVRNPSESYRDMAIRDARERFKELK